MTADERHQVDLRRALLDVDRERSAVARLQKDLDQARRVTGEQTDRHRAQTSRLLDELGQQKLGATEGALAEARGAYEALRAQLEKRLEVKRATQNGPAEATMRPTPPSLKYHGK